MCYNYEYVVARGAKLTRRENGSIDFSSLSERDRIILEEKAERLNMSLEDAYEQEEDEPTSLFPGKESWVIPITTGEREKYIFGFLPDFASSPNDNRMNFNCRSETILEKPTWKKPFTRCQRCLVLASAFFETDRSTKMRYRFSVIGEPEIYYAGIYNHWTDKTDGKVYKTFAIITCEPNGLVASVHNRMPVILNANARNIWLNIESSTDMLVNCFIPYPADLMERTEAPAPPRKKKPKKGEEGSGELKLDF